MSPEILELYMSKCQFEKKCNPEPRKRKYNSGSTYYVTQCTSCGANFGQALAKRLFQDSSLIKEFDEEFVQKCNMDTNNKLSALAEKIKLLNQIRKRLKSDYFKNILKLPFNNFETAYNAYLSSDAWHLKRQVILKRDKHLCQFCNSAKATQVHHLSYDNLGNESDFELISLCHKCHQFIHNIEENKNYNDRSQRKEL
jgi:hypothetical protein